MLNMICLPTVQSHQKAIQTNADTVSFRKKKYNYDYGKF